LESVGIRESPWLSNSVASPQGYVTFGQHPPEPFDIDGATYRITEFGIHTPVSCCRQLMKMNTIMPSMTSQNSLASNKFLRQGSSSVPLCGVPAADMHDDGLDWVGGFVPPGLGDASFRFFNSFAPTVTFMHSIPGTATS
jgi:hypothetical protein